jgi:L-alanine-DL-glutamate epimerase-like enolase superfamily enzyme
MKIAAVRLYVLEAPEQPASVDLKLIRVPNLLRFQVTQTRVPNGQPLRQNFIEVETDDGRRARCTTFMLPHQIGILRQQVLGVDVHRREYLFQLLHKGTRWVYQPPGWFGDFDNCLWDLLGQEANLPIYALIGRVRDRFPVYLTHHDADLKEYLRQIEAGRQIGIRAYKFHSFKGGDADQPIFKAVRKEVGPDYTLISDPVCSYTLREAIEVGHLMEELNFVWLEEPFHEQKLHDYQVLCRELTLPVLATEMLMHDLSLTTQWLIQGGTDRLRANARNGTTQVLKMAHFAEQYAANIEMNAQGGLAGLIHAHLGCCIDNTDYYEHFSTAGDSNRVEGELWGLLNGPLIEDGHIAPPDGPGWGAVWDEARFRSRIVAEY